MRIAPCTDTAVKLLLQLATPPRAKAALAPSGQAALPAVSPRDADEPDWRNAYRRLREQEPGEAEPPPPAALVVPVVKPEPEPEVAEVRSLSPTPTVERLEAARQLGQPQPMAPAAARVWQVELPAPTGPAWRLEVEQARPLAPLHLELRVPPVAQAQARQQLGDLDKRLRDAGHDVLRSRLRDAARTDKRSLPVDEVRS